MKDTSALSGSVRNCLLGLAVGDALGMPWETLKHEEILTMNSGHSVTEMSDAVQQQLTDTAGFKRGMTTDDTQLSVAVAESLIDCHGFDLKDQARRHLAAYEGPACGWGGTTRIAMESLKAGRDPNVPMPPIEVAPGRKPKGRGNGIAMKIAPLALWHALAQGRFETEPLLTDTLALGRLTHPDLRASTAAYAIAVVVARNFLKPWDGTDPKSCLDFVIEQARLAEARYRSIQDDVDSVSARLEIVKRAFADLDALLREVRPGCDALESVPFSIGVFLRHPNDIEAALSEAATAGGDTDTNAAMVGAMCGANLDETRGGQPIPERWINDLADQGRGLTDLAARLTAAALR
jgi:ADP-ribosylglycohydrolase